MTDSKALIERLRDNFDLTECEHGFRLYGEHTCPNEDCDRRNIRQAVNHIEKLEADNARLREALTTLVEEYVTNVDCTRIGGFYLDPESEECVMEARAALAGDSHD